MIIRSLSHRNRFAPIVAAAFILGLLLILTSSLVSASGDLHPANVNGHRMLLSGLQPVAAAGHLRRVNVPYFTTGVLLDQAAVFWLGQVTPDTQYGDIRMGYNNNKLVINANVADRLLWYNANNPSPANLTSYDSITIYLSKSGNSIGSPDANSYRFDTGFTWWEKNRAKWQVAYKGNGSGWTRTAIPFFTRSGWRGDQPNNLRMDRGWNVTLSIPFASLGLSGPPSQGTEWGLAVALHNRNDAAGTPIPDQVWPENIGTTNPTTWGQLRFGSAPAYSPPPAQNLTTTTIKNGVNGQVATTTNVGGSTTCATNLGNFGLVYWQQWGIQNWVNSAYLNVMNQMDIADWPCYNKVYAMFPLASLPRGKVITSATLTFYQFGHAGTGGQHPGPSLIQIYSTDTDWTPSAINWNNAPWPNENLDRQWAGTGNCPTYKNCPSVTLNVSQQVADAYAAGQPLRVILYDSDDQISSGKYFFSSEQEDWNARNRPALQVTFGDP